ncbi:MAG: 50S ribosomal protein L25/general stress protein Ctc [Alphaproteobacteria bacterium]
MSTLKSLEVTTRAEIGTGPARAERRKGFVPGILYGNKKEPLAVSIEERLLVKEMSIEGFLSHLYELNVAGKKEQVLVRSVQFHPVTDRPISIDFIRVGATSKITIDVPLHFINEAQCAALKQGGVLNTLRHSLPLICSPNQIPEFIELDLAPLTIGSSISLADLNIPSYVQVSHPERVGTVLTIVPPKVVDESAAAEAAPAAASAAEPEKSA